VEKLALILLHGIMLTAKAGKEKIMKIDTIKASAGHARECGKMTTEFSHRNSVYELKKNKSKFKNAWKKEARAFM